MTGEVVPLRTRNPFSVQQGSDGQGVHFDGAWNNQPFARLKFIDNEVLLTARSPFQISACILDSHHRETLSELRQLFAEAGAGDAVQKKVKELLFAVAVGDLGCRVAMTGYGLNLS